MRPDGPSLTAAGVAAARAVLERPSTPTGDREADDRLAASVASRRTDARRERRRRDTREFLSYIATRTKFFDDAVLRAIDTGIAQVVLLGAGYDGRALRFRTPGVRFFEVDHPATQRDKRARLDQLLIDSSDITFVAADFTEPGLGDALARAGHDADAPSLFTCEGVLRYLPEPAFRGLLATAANRAAGRSELAASISTRERGVPESAERLARERQLAAIGEAVLTVPDRQTALAWLREAGWPEITVDEVASFAPGTRPGRLLVVAHRT
ncbi:MAG TPA: SAM-dependent methyltransferase [Acidimicrobiia bacterium]|nr:SAM-dependent methyltransferase [Acidimicrobiia bacterium]